MRLQCSFLIGVARGCSGCTYTPQGGEKNFSGLIYMKNVYVHPLRTRSAPPARVRVNFRTVFAEWLRFGGIFRWSVRATTKKSRQLFLTKKVHPQTKYWLRL